MRPEDQARHAILDDQAEHIAPLTSMLRGIDWQVNRDCGSQWLAGELYRLGARVPYGRRYPAVDS